MKTSVKYLPAKDSKRLNLALVVNVLYARGRSFSYHARGRTARLVKRTIKRQGTSTFSSMFTLSFFLLLVVLLLQSPGVSIFYCSITNSFPECIDSAMDKNDVVVPGQCVGGHNDASNGWFSRHGLVFVTAGGGIISARTFVGFGRPVSFLF